MHYDFRHRRIRFGDCRRDARQVRMTLIMHRNRCAIFRSARSRLQRLVTRRSYNETVTWYCVTRSKLRTHSEAQLWDSARTRDHLKTFMFASYYAHTAQRFHVNALYKFTLTLTLTLTLRRSRSFDVTNFYTNRNPVYASSYISE